MSALLEFKTTLSADLRDEWLALYEAAHNKTIFQHPDWTAAWLESKEDPNLGIYVRSEHQHVTGVISGKRIRNVVYLGANFHSDYHLPLLKDESEEDLESFLRLIGENRYSVLLQEVPKNSVYSEYLTNQNLVLIQHRTLCPCIDLSEFDHVNRILNKKSTYRKFRKLEKLGDVKISHSFDHDYMDTCLSELVSLHVNRWAASTTPSLFTRYDGEAFYRNLLRSRFPLLWSELRVNDRLVAGHIGVIDSKKLLWYKPAFDLKFSNASPGEVLVLEVIRFASQNGYEVFDFTRGQEAYKYRYANLETENLTLLVCNSPVEKLVVQSKHKAREAARVLKRVFLPN